MQVDFQTLDQAVSTAVITMLENAKSGIPPKPRYDKSNISVKQACIHGFIRPMVERELQRQLLKDVQKVVRIRDRKSNSSMESVCIASYSTKKKNSSTKKIAAGFFGGVYAIDELRVAKVIRIELTTTLDDFNFEVKMQRQAGEIGIAPNVIDAFSCFEDDNGILTGIIIMERIKGVTLSTWIQRSSRTITELRIMRAKIDALIIKMHKASIYHNDLHTENIMISRNGNPFIIDFGLASKEPKHAAEIWELRFFKGDANRHNDFHVVDFVASDLNKKSIPFARGINARSIYRNSVIDDVTSDVTRQLHGISVLTLTPRI